MFVSICEHVAESLASSDARRLAAQWPSFSAFGPFESIDAAEKYIAENVADWCKEKHHILALSR